MTAGTFRSQKGVKGMKKINLKNFFKEKKMAAGCIAAAALITAGSLSMVWQDSQVPELPNYTDPVVEQTIEDDDTPLASQPKVTTKTTKSSKTIKKNIKLKKASTKTYTKKLPTTKKVSTKTTKQNRTTTVKTQTTVQKDTNQKYTKKSKNVVQTQKVTTTIKTTTTVAAAKTTGTKATTAGTTVKKEKYTVADVATIAPKMDSKVLNAYKKMGFTVTVDPSVSYAGYFDARTRSITLQSADDTIYHELGHYLAFIAGNVDKSSSFAAVYNSEKSKFTGVRKAYATQNASEYFAESVQNYVENPSALKAQRPKTYEAVKNAFDKVTDAQVNKIINVYKVVWK